MNQKSGLNEHVNIINLKRDLNRLPCHVYTSPISVSRAIALLELLHARPVTGSVNDLVPILSLSVRSQITIVSSSAADAR